MVKYNHANNAHFQKTPPFEEVLLLVDVDPGVPCGVPGLDTNTIDTAGKRTVAECEAAVRESSALALRETRCLIPNPLEARAQKILHLDLDALDSALLGSRAAPRQAVGAETVCAPLGHTRACAALRISQPDAFTRAFRP
jgi:hypothetical protein